MNTLCTMKFSLKVPKLKCLVFFLTVREINKRLSKNKYSFNENITKQQPMKAST